MSTNTEALRDIANASENWMCEAGARQMKDIARAALAASGTPSPDAPSLEGDAARAVVEALRAAEFAYREMGVSMRGEYAQMRSALEFYSSPTKPQEPADDMRFENVKREAQQWKQEARTANATIAEIYQLSYEKGEKSLLWFKR